MAYSDREQEREYQRQYRRRNQEVLREKAKARYNREERLAYQRRYYEEHRDERLAYQKDYQTRALANPVLRARINARKQAWYHTERGRELNNAAQRRRYARLGKRPPANVREYALILRNDPCAYCGAPMEEWDHIIPVNQGGPTTWDNLTASCRRCNRSKSDKSLLAWLSPVTLTKENV